MKSAKMEEDLELFLSHEVDLRLLDLEGVELPESQPIIPPLPPIPVGI